MTNSTQPPEGAIIIPGYNDYAFDPDTRVMYSRRTFNRQNERPWETIAGYRRGNVTWFKLYNDDGEWQTSERIITRLLVEGGSTP